jgi:ribosomal-protein-alanine N-acetyltransferase
MHDIAGEGYITNVAVAPRFRRLGVATALLGALLSYAKENGLLFITLEVRESNRAARLLYGGLGFTDEGTRRNFYTDPAEDAIIMTKHLTGNVVNT